MPHTPEQEKVVKQVLSAKGDYYRVLAVERTSSDGDIKKAYRKLALKIHPDKNSHPSAPEAFKAASRAFEVLLDASKKRIYDQTGQDPDLRPTGATSGFARRTPFTAGNTQEFAFDEDIFNMFFGAQPGVNAFSFGPGGFNFQAFDNRQRRRQRRPPQQPAQPETTWSRILLFLPMILVFVFMLASLFLGETQEKAPEFRYAAVSPYTVQMQTPNYEVTYYITEDKLAKLKKKDIAALHRMVEEDHVSRLEYRCLREQSTKEQLLGEAQGFFFTDEKLLKKAKRYPTPSCDQLRDYGII